MDVVISAPDEAWAVRWGRQFQAAAPGSRAALLMHSGNRHQVVDSIHAAAARAGNGGTVIFNVGHGGSGSDPSVGMVDLAPHERFRVQTELVYYAVDPDGTGAAHSQQDSDRTAIRMDQELEQQGRAADPDLHRVMHSAAQRSRSNQGDRADYDAIGAALRAAGARRVVFISCNVGNSTRFLDQIASDWGVEALAYRRTVALWEDDDRLVRIYFDGDEVGRASNTERARTELPDSGMYQYLARPAVQASPRP